MLYLALGIAVLVLALWLLRIFAEADPAKLARGAVQIGLILGGAAAVVLLVLLLFSGRFGLGVTELSGLVAVGIRLWAQWRRRRPVHGPASGGTSEVETDYLRMRLDHESGAMSGTVRRGPFVGRSLDTLSRAELVALWRECCAEDEAGAKLLEAYLDRLAPDWRESAREERASRADAPRADAMTREEAYAVLGLQPGAGEAAIREAHRRLMLKLHPDHGGSTYLAAKLNRAREVLLGG